MWYTYTLCYARALDKLSVGHCRVRGEEPNAILRQDGAAQSSEHLDSNPYRTQTHMHRWSGKCPIILGLWMNQKQQQQKLKLKKKKRIYIVCWQCKYLHEIWTCERHRITYAWSENCSFVKTNSNNNKHRTSHTDQPTTKNDQTANIVYRAAPYAEQINRK